MRFGHYALSGKWRAGCDRITLQARVFQTYRFVFGGAANRVAAGFTRATFLGYARHGHCAVRGYFTLR